MADEEDKRKCKNPACSCIVTDEKSKYCSASCEGAGQMVELDCDCSHPECSGNF